MSAYACEPDSGSEPGAGYAIVRAAAQVAECWVLTRTNNVPALRAAFESEPAPNLVHFVGVDAHPFLLGLKRRFNSVRLYYLIWQKCAGRIASDLDSHVDFDLVHHATLSQFWMPIGVMRLGKPLVVGPASGATVAPLSLIHYLGAPGVVLEAVRWVNSRVAAVMWGRKWKRAVSLILVQDAQTKRLVMRHLAASDTSVMVHSNASNPSIKPIPDRLEQGRNILCVGRLRRRKGILLALEAFVESDVGQARLIYVGEGRGASLLRRRIRRMGVEDRVDLDGHVPHSELLRRMRTASAVIFPSLNDSAGFVVSEALSLGVPLVCLDHGGPAVLTRQWPDSPSVAVAPSCPATVRRQMAAAISHYVESEIAQSPSARAALVGTADVVQEVYRRVARQSRTPRSGPGETT